eukprot:597565-Lingulodinium_polyedra.AAC.1
MENRPPGARGALQGNTLSSSGRASWFRSEGRPDMECAARGFSASSSRIPHHPMSPLGPSLST